MTTGSRRYEFGPHFYLSDLKTVSPVSQPRTWGESPFNRTQIFYRLLKRAKPGISPFVAVKGAAAQKFSSGWESKSRANPCQIVNLCAVSLQMRGIILASRAVVSPRTPSIAEGNSHRGMKFSEKYELLESLTTGAIETFVANDKIRGERVLVHIVECAPQTPDQSAAEWALESFRKLAPEACGPVLETGKYSPPKYAYVVVKPADEATAKAWVRRYELQADETRETKAHTLRKEISPPAEFPAVATPPIAAPQPSHPPGSMTQLLRDYDSLVKSKSPETPSLPDLPPVKPAASTNLPGESGLHAAPAWE